jgi:hypothetical protein
MRVIQNGSDSPKCMSQLYAIELNKLVDGNVETLNVDFCLQPVIERAEIEPSLEKSKFTRQSV